MESVDNETRSSTERQRVSRREVTVLLALLIGMPIAMCFRHESKGPSAGKRRCPNEGIFFF